MTKLLSIDNPPVMHDSGYILIPVPIPIPGKFKSVIPVPIPVPVPIPIPAKIGLIPESIPIRESCITATHNLNYPFRVPCWQKPFDRNYLPSINDLFLGVYTLRKILHKLTNPTFAN